LRRSRKIISTLFLGVLTLTTSLSLVGCALQPNSPQPTDVAPPQPAGAPPATQPVETAWPAISKVLERPGVLHDSVYTITVPRDDLEVGIEGMGVPIAAGIESIFHFYRCPCGKMNVVGQFVAADYEANDIIDALRQNATLKVASMSPFLLHEKPQLLLVRFQGEGDAVVMAGNLREALRWMGRERMAPDPLPKPEPK
jgi:hypothetical protein